MEAWQHNYGEFFSNDGNLFLVKKGLLYGYTDSNGTEIVKPQYDYAHLFTDGLACVCKNNLWGFINEKGEVVIDLNYNYANPFKNKKSIVHSQNKYGVITINNKVIVHLIYDYINEYYDYYIVTMGGLKGLIDNENKTILNCEFEDIMIFSAQSIIIVKKNNKYGCYASNGELISKCVFDNYSQFKNISNEEYENINLETTTENNKAIISAEFEIVNYHSDDFIVVMKNNKYGVIDIIGNSVIEIRYDYFYPNYEQNLIHITENILAAKIDKIRTKHGVINFKGEVIVPAIYDRVADFIGDYAIVENKDELSFFNGQGSINTFYGVVDKFNKEAIPCEYEYIGIYSNGLFPAKKNNLYGFINSRNEIIIPFVYNFVNHFCDNVAVASINGLYGYINNNGLFSDALKYTNATNFINDLATVQNQQGLWGLIDSSFNEILPCNYNNIVIDAKKDETIIVAELNDFTYKYKNGKCISKGHTPRDNYR